MYSCCDHCFVRKEFSFLDEDDFYTVRCLGSCPPVVVLKSLEPVCLFSTDRPYIAVVTYYTNGWMDKISDWRAWQDFFSPLFACTDLDLSGFLAETKRRVVPTTQVCNYHYSKRLVCRFSCQNLFAYPNNLESWLLKVSKARCCVSSVWISALRQMGEIVTGLETRPQTQGCAAQWKRSEGGAPASAAGGLEQD